MALVAWLQDLDRKAIELAGGKAANLGELLPAGLPVPPGFYTAPGTAPDALVGTAASPGVYEGTVRVVLDPQAAKLEPGEVLMAPGTDPAWTPLFLSAGALVMELGGVMSHGSVVAREYAIPAVVGVPGATRRLRTGQRVRVDGESG